MPRVGSGMESIAWSFVRADPPPSQRQPVRIAELRGPTLSATSRPHSYFWLCAKMHYCNVILHLTVVESGGPCASIGATVSLCTDHLKILFVTPSSLTAELQGKDGRTLDLMDWFHRFALDSSTEFLFGESVESLIHPKAII